MKKILLLLLFPLIFSCNSKNESKFIGNWEMPKSKSAGIMSVTENGENYLIEIKDDKFVGTLKDDILIINIKGHEMQAMIDKDDQLIMNGKTTVRVKN